MQPKKEILLFYVLIVISTGVIIAAKQPQGHAIKKSPVKCCKISRPTPLNTFTESILRHKA
jgi:hypothetical protein